MKPAALLCGLLAFVQASEVFVKFSASNLVQGAEDGRGEASVMSLSRLALESLAIPHSTLGASSLPLVADVFTHADAFGIVLLENYAKELALAKDGYAFQKRLDLEEASTGQFPSLVNVLAQGVKHKNANSQTLCAGSVCAKLDKEVKQVQDAKEIAAETESVWTAVSTLERSVAADLAFVEELASLRVLTKHIESASSQAHAKKLYVGTVSSFNNLAPQKQEEASAAVEAAVKEFQQTLKNKFSKVGVQVLRLNKQMTIDVKALSEATALARRLAEPNAVTLSANGTSPTPLTIENIAEYQVILWSSVILVVIIFVAISVMSSIDASRDNLLYAKFLTDPSGRKHD